MSSDGLALAIQGIKEELECYPATPRVHEDDPDWGEGYGEGYRQALLDTLGNLELLQRSLARMGS